MSSANNPISHHTSHTMGNGASSSSNGAYGYGTGSTDAANNQGAVLEASLINHASESVNLSTTTGLWSEPSPFNDNVVTNASPPCAASDSFSESSGSENAIGSSNTSMCLPKTISNFSIIDSTLREGEQFATAYFDTAQKLKIAQALDDFGVEYIEVTSPAASEQSRSDCAAICRLGLKAKILCHIRCNMDDARSAVQTGVDGINMCIGTSSHLMQHSHGKDMSYIATKAMEVIKYVKSDGIEIRFSGEDSFRSDFSEILTLYSLVDQLGVDRVGIADTVGGATPMEVYEKIKALRQVVSCDIETHFHNDTGCAVANAYTALEAGATHIDTTILGIGERNGITPLGGLVASLIPLDRDYILSKYKVEKLNEIECLVAEIVKVEIPFNNFAMPPAESGQAKAN